MPDAHGTFMRLIGFGVADAVNDTKVSFFIEAEEGFHTRVKGNVPIDLVQIPCWQAEGLAVASVFVVGVGDDGVESIVTAG
jgi:hypothetical protein